MKSKYIYPKPNGQITIKIPLNLNTIVEMELYVKNHLKKLKII